MQGKNNQPSLPEKASAEGALLRQFQKAMTEVGNSDLIATDPQSRALLSLTERGAKARTTILITGPSGSGKEVIARHIHRTSPRADKPFVAINCAALPESMIESMLFGHERGAFTGAQNANPGLFRAADGGTLFLDELGELPLAQQAKLLRVLEQREVLPIGATRPVPVDIRLVAASNCNLAQMVEDGDFRADLLWRLSVFPLELKPLAARPLDIIPLAAHILHNLSAVDGAPPSAITEAAIARLQRYSWPGNVRELANCLERARILANGNPIDVADLGLAAEQAFEEESLADTLRDSEAQAIARALAESGGRRASAAIRLGISERTLRYKLAAISDRRRSHQKPSDAKVVLQ